MRPPVVTIMGHVDHGKTTLLDAIRESKVVETEAGGITQHIGAYQVQVEATVETANGRRITFLDTPGHEAFTAMRARGAKVTDIAVLVVAARTTASCRRRASRSRTRARPRCPSSSPSTRSTSPTRTRPRQATSSRRKGLQPEEWGGQTQFAEVSARKNARTSTSCWRRSCSSPTLEVDPKANPKAEASGPIIESRLDVGRGPVATMLVQRGTLHVGDAIVGRRRVGEGARAATTTAASACARRPGRPGRDPRLRQAAARRRARPRGRERAPGAPPRERCAASASAASSWRSALKAGVSLEGLFTAMQAGAVQDLNLVLKGDVQGSLEALVGELGKIQHPEVRRERHPPAAWAAITESDIMLASASNALVVGFNVRPNAEARRSPSARASRSAPTASSTS